MAYDVAMMEVDSDNDLLSRITAGEQVDAAAWPALRSDMLARLDKIAHEVFPIPKMPPPTPPARLSDTRLLSPLPSSPSDAGETDKENAPVSETVEPQQPLEEPGALPKQIADMLEDIKRQVGRFDTHPPHTLQRLAELVLKPRAHYRALAPYLHAVDRVVQVTSGTSTYPLAPSILDMSSMHLNGDEPKDPALAVSWSNPTTVAVGSDEALGGALLTPIPWLSRRSPESCGGGGTPGAQIHSEGTETIDGPNGVGSIETVSVSVNGVPSTGHARGVTQGELLRQEQRAGVVPVNQLNRAPGTAADNGHGVAAAEDQSMEDSGEEEVPHARGPEEIGVNDTGPQRATTSHVGEGGLEMQDIDVEAAVGRRKHGDGDGDGDGDGNADDGEPLKSPGAESVGSKREAGETLEGDAATKKIKEDTLSDSNTTATLSAGGSPNMGCLTDAKDSDNNDDKMEEN